MTTAEDATKIIQQTMPLCETLGITAIEFLPTSVRLSLPWAPPLCTSGGLLHGGVVMALADSAGAGVAGEASSPGVWPVGPPEAGDTPPEFR